MYKKKKRKFEKKKIIIICTLVFCLILGFVANVMVTDRKLSVFEKAIKDSILTVEKGIRYPFDYIGKKITESKEKKKMFEDYQDLKRQLEEANGLAIKNQELEKQLRELQELLEINNIL